MPIVTQNKVFLTRTFTCSVDELYNWLVKPELIVQWFGPKQVSVGTVHTDVRVGGSYSIELIKPGGSTILIEGEYLDVNPPHSLTFSFHYAGANTSAPSSVVKIVLRQVAPNEAQLLLTQEFEWTPQDMVSRSDSWEHMLTVLSSKIDS